MNKGLARSASVFALAGSALATAQAPAKPPPLARPRTVIEQLEKIQTAAGVNVYARMQRCGIRIEAASGLDDGGSFANPGERQLNVFIDVPPMDESQHDRDLFTGLNAIWVISKDGHGRPMTGWAKNLESKVPLGSIGWLN